MRFNVNADLFRNVARAVSTESTRPYLCGVLIEPHDCGGVYLVATDGHRMIVAYDPEGMTDGRHIVPAPRDLLRQTARKKARGMTSEHSRRIVATGDAVQVHNGRDILVSFIIEPIGGTFPTWQNVVPTVKGEGSVSAHNPAYVSEFMDLALDLRACGWGGCLPRMLSNGEGEPTVVTYGTSAPVFAVLMPMRFEPAELPAFYGARPFDRPEVELSKLMGHYPMNCEAFEVRTRQSPLHVPVTRRFVFESKAAATRAFNRYRAILEARGVKNLPEPVHPHTVISNAMLDERKRRVAAIDSATVAFAEATDQDIAMPWRRALLPQTTTRTIKAGRRTFTVTEAMSPAGAVGALPHLSEARLLATAYRMAA